jgi:cytochrome P450
MSIQPPGPPGHAIANFRERCRDFLGLLEQLTHEYGNVAELRMLQVLMIVVNEPDLIDRVLVHEDSNFDKIRDLKSAYPVFGKRSVLLIDGEDHARIRRLIQPGFHHQRFAGYGDMMAARASAWQEPWQPGDVRDIHHELEELTRDLICEAMFGISMMKDAQRVGQAVQNLNAHFHQLTLPLQEIWRHLPLPGVHALNESVRILDETITRLVEERRASGRDEGDVITMLLAAQDTEGGTRPLDAAEVHDQVATLFFAGHETTCSALTWTLYLLAKHPEIQEKVRAEILQALGNQKPGYENLQAIKYTHAVVSESLRILPPVWAIGREAKADLEIGGFRIPKGSSVVLSQFLAHRDPRWWPEPLRFKPERWLEAPHPARPKFAYFPFGGGRRTCIGERFAWMEMLVLLASFLRQWKFSLCDQTEDPPGFLVGLTLAPKNGMRLKIDAVG